MDLVAWAAREAELRLSPLGSRWAHTQAVAARAQAVAAAVPEADRELLVAAAYLHDIGYAPELADSGFHPLDGARWLRAQGHERLACLVAHHSAAQFEAQTRGLADELEAFPEEHSSTADALGYCDLTTDSAGRPVTLEARLADIDARYGNDTEVIRGVRGAAPELAALVARSEARLASLGIAAA
jgi:putative nucleotidyltransferase with HDIG domain